MSLSVQWLTMAMMLLSGIGMGVVFDGYRVVLGAWVVVDESAGLGIRESSGPITDEYARFLPHVIL